MIHRVAKKSFCLTPIALTAVSCMYGVSFNDDGVSLLRP